MTCEQLHARAPRVVLRGGTRPARTRKTPAGYTSMGSWPASRNAAHRANPTCIQPATFDASAGVTHGTQIRACSPSAISPQRAVRNFGEIDSLSRCGAVLSCAGASIAISSAPLTSATTPSRSAASKVRAATTIGGAPFVAPNPTTWIVDAPRSMPTETGCTPSCTRGSTAKSSGWDHQGPGTCVDGKARSGFPTRLADCETLKLPPIEMTGLSP